jgi:hypothetical protein
LIEGKGDSEQRGTVAYGLGHAITDLEEAHPGDFLSYSTTPRGFSQFAAHRPRGRAPAAGDRHWHQALISPGVDEDFASERRTKKAGGPAS